MDKEVLKSFNCISCGKKLAEVKIIEGVVAIKCSKCGTMNVKETEIKTIKVTQY